MKTTETKDLFLNIESLPIEVQNVLNAFSEKNNTYSNCKKLEVRLFKHGYTFDFGLDAIPFNLRKIDINKQIKDDKNTMQYHEISKIHAEALLKNDKKVFGFVSGFVEEITNIEQAEKYFID